MHNKNCKENVSMLYIVYTQYNHATDSFIIHTHVKCLFDKINFAFDCWIYNSLSGFTRNKTSFIEKILSMLNIHIIVENIAAVRRSNFARRIPHDRFREYCEKEKYYWNSIDNSNRVSSNYRKIKYRWTQRTRVSIHAIFLFFDLGQSEYVKRK